ncbi:hypothetical protein NDU88_000095 [Pleurodeles waltl]|uniref:Uncharacterized protein n=1 Tax=Pleurodeles waltl TaxID=8319 RepID=A0AAV7S954_PLEWA|nr:hypothetical protein NDU88_000095 [Pleurodeles waltl]
MPRGLFTFSSALTLKLCTPEAILQVFRLSPSNIRRNTFLCKECRPATFFSRSRHREPEGSFTTEEHKRAQAAAWGSRYGSLACTGCGNGRLIELTGTPRGVTPRLGGGCLEC